MIAATEKGTSARPIGSSGIILHEFGDQAKGVFLFLLQRISFMLVQGEIRRTATILPSFGL